MAPSDAPRARRAAWLLAAIVLPCPDSPNCVSSTSGDADQRVPPIACAAPSQDAAVAAARAVIETFPRARISGAKPGVVHAEFTTFLFRYVDDVTLVWDGPAHAFQVISASRSGFWDLGSNRRRVEKLRDAIAERCAAAPPVQAATTAPAADGDAAGAPPAPADGVADAAPPVESVDPHDPVP